MTLDLPHTPDPSKWLPDRDIFAHVVPWFPTRFANEEADKDYYARNYLTVGGESGKHAKYGGYLRDRPTPQPVSASKTWQADDVDLEIATAQAAGIGGFSVDLTVFPAEATAASKQNADHIALIFARAAVAGFPVMVMPDMTSPGLAAKSAAALATSVATLGKSPAAYRLPDGRLVVCPFQGDKSHPASWWKDFLIAVTTLTPVAFWPMFLSLGPTTVSDFAKIGAYGLTEWGPPRDPKDNDPTVTGARIAAVHDAGLKWMAPVAFQDYRPSKGRVVGEALGTATLRTMWTNAIAGDAELVHLETWNDFAEHTHHRDSLYHDSDVLAVDAFYGEWYRRGAAPAIDRDMIVLTQRVQPAAAQPTGGQSVIAKFEGATPATDMVELLSFLTGPAQVGGITLPAGVYVNTMPLPVEGAPAATVTRHGQPIMSVLGEPVVAPPVVQNLMYMTISSVYDPPVAPTDEEMAAAFDTLAGAFAVYQDIAARWREGKDLPTG